MRNPEDDSDLPSVRTLHSSDWKSGDDGLREARYHVGQSSDGFHYYVELSCRGGDVGLFHEVDRLNWSDAFDSVATVTAQAKARAYEWVSPQELASVDLETH